MSRIFLEKTRTGVDMPMNEHRDDTILEKIVRRERVFDGLILHIDHADAILPNGKIAKREIAVHVGASAVVPVDEQGNAYFVRQYRAPIERVLLEIPAGKLDAPDEDRLLAAKRELTEETGLTAGRWDHLADVVTTPGFSSEKISLYLARDLVKGASSPDEDEFLNVEKIPLKQVRSEIFAGKIQDAKTICAVLLAWERINAEK